MFKILKDAAKPTKDVLSAAVSADAIGYFNGARCGAAFPDSKGTLC